MKEQNTQQNRYDQNYEIRITRVQYGVSISIQIPSIPKYLQFIFFLIKNFKGKYFKSERNSDFNFDIEIHQEVQRERARKRKRENCNICISADRRSRSKQSRELAAPKNAKRQAGGGGVGWFV